MRKHKWLSLALLLSLVTSPAAARPGRRGEKAVRYFRVEIEASWTQYRTHKGSSDYQDGSARVVVTGELAPAGRAGNKR